MSMAPSVLKDLEYRAFVKSLAKNFKGIRTADELEPVQGIPTGVHMFDDTVVGIGGLPRGRLVELYGWESVGKTTVAHYFVAQAQKRGGICAWFDAEGAYDPSWAARIGVDNSKLIFPSFYFAEECFQQIKYMVASDAVDLIVIDSLATLIPNMMLVRDGQEPNMRVNLARAQAMTVFTQELIGGFTPKGGKEPLRLYDSKTCVLFLNHVKNAIGVKYGNPEQTPGGVALDFAASIRLDIRRAGKTENKDKDGMPAFIWSSLTARKNKCAPPFRKCFVRIFRDGRVEEDIDDVLELLVKAEIVEKAGGWYKSDFWEGSKRKDEVEELWKSSEEFRRTLTGNKVIDSIFEEVEEEEVEEEEVEEVEEEEVEEVEEEEVEEEAPQTKKVIKPSFIVGIPRKE